jgi:PPK2 family polyphosphate:nucleotide phosphotransferase
MAGIEWEEGSSMAWSDRLIVKHGSKVRLSTHDPDDDLGLDKEEAEEELEAARQRLADLHQLLWAENQRAILVILQGMDTSGKDGTIRHVMSGVNPQGCRVTSFKRPSDEELDHDFLWRVHLAAPGLGEIGIFNRSQYEDVLVVRVHNLVPKEIWSKRYAQINEFERMLTQNGVVLLKFFLHISKKEQKERLQERLKDPTKNWKFSEGDLAERTHWDEYMEAYQDALRRCGTPWAPWRIVPADRKWVRNLAVSRTIIETLEGMKMKWPRPKMHLSKIRIK